MKITFKRKLILTISLRIAIVLFILSIMTKISTFVFGHGNLLGLIPKFDMDKEANIPTLFNTILLAASSSLFLLQSISKQQNDPLFERKRLKILGLVFAYMAVDEITSIHEMLINPLRAWFNLSGAFYYSWVVVGFVIVSAFLVYFMKFFLRKPRSVQLGLFFAGFLYVGGALGIEMLGGAYASAFGELNLTYGLITCVEEACELFGLIILNNTLLKELSPNGAIATFQVDIIE